MSAPAQQSVIPNQTTAAGLDPDIQSRVSQFTQKIGYGPILETPSTSGLSQSSAVPTSGMFGGQSQQIVNLAQGD